ncbi:GNAT family N-acetyltransferase [Spirosoma areae]
MPTTPIRIVPYTAQHQQGVIDLVLGIQQAEFGIPISLADQPDLLTIETFYQSKRGGFWCALTETGHVVGTISLIDVGEEFGTIRKMFVHADFRGRELALATLLLQTLEDHAAAVDLKTLYLGTLDILAAAQRFYAKNGYLPIAMTDLPNAFPRMRLDNRFFWKALGKSA